MSDVRKSYARVVLVWAVVLVALYVFEQYFS